MVGNCGGEGLYIQMIGLDSKSALGACKSFQVRMSFKLVLNIVR